MSTFETVVLGIVSSLLATYLFLMLTWFVRTAVVPWFENKIYRGVRLDGRWKIRFEEQKQEEPFGVLQLMQNGDALSGSLTHESKTKSDITTYTVSGYVANAYVNISLAPASKDMIDMGAIVARIFYTNGLHMDGVLTYISTKEGNVESTNVCLEHADS